MAFTSAITLAASAARDTSGSGSGMDCGAKRAARLTLAVSTVSGATPSLTVYVETSPDNASWIHVGAFSARGAVGEQTITVGGCSRYLRARWVVSAGASFTFGVAGEAVLAYADPDDIPRVFKAAALASITAHDQVEALIAATEEFDGLFNGRYALPLVSWGSDLRKHVAAVAVCGTVLARGVNPESSEYEVLTSLRDAAYDWAKAVGASSISPPGIVDSTPTVNDSGPFCCTSSKRGW